MGGGDVRHRVRYAVGSFGCVVNIRTFTTHMGLVRIAVAAPENTRFNNFLSPKGPDMTD